MLAKSTLEAVEARERSKDTSNRHSEDQEIRAAGFKIHSRPTKGPILWEFGGVVCEQSQALQTIRKEKELKTLR